MQHKFLDQNANGLFDGVHELGDLISTRGTVGSSLESAQGTPVTDLEPSYADEISFSVEHELMADTSLRFSYVRKQLRNDFGLTWNQALETGGVLVSNEVEISVEVELIRQAKQAAA